MFTKDGQFVRTIGVTGQWGSGNHQFAGPYDVCVDSGPDGHLFVVEWSNKRVQVLKKDGTYVRTIGITRQAGMGNDRFNNPWGVCVEPGPDGRLYVADTSNRRVQVLNKDTGAHVHTYGVAGQSGGGNHLLSGPKSVAVEQGPDGLVYVADFGNHRVHVFCKPV